MSNPTVNAGHGPSSQWFPDHVRRQVMRQARYALNVAALDEDRVPPEGPFDVALTNLGRERLRDMRPQHVAGVRSRLLEPVRGHDLPALTAAIASIINSEHAAPLAAASSTHKEVIAS